LSWLTTNIYGVGDEKAVQKSHVPIRTIIALTCVLPAERKVPAFWARAGMTEKTPRRGSSECRSIVGAGKCQRENKEKIRRRNKGMTNKREKIKGKKRRALIEGKDKLYGRWQRTGEGR